MEQIRVTQYSLWMDLFYMNSFQPNFLNLGVIAIENPDSKHIPHHSLLPSFLNSELLFGLLLHFPFGPNGVEPMLSQESGASFGSAIWVQGSKHLGCPLLLSLVS